MHHGRQEDVLEGQVEGAAAKKGEIEAEIKKRNRGRKMSIVGGSLKLIGPLDVEEGELRGVEGVGKGSKVVPMIGGEEIKAVEGESDAQKMARLERED